GFLQRALSRFSAGNESVPSGQGSRALSHCFSPPPQKATGPGSSGARFLSQDFAPTDGLQAADGGVRRKRVAYRPRWHRRNIGGDHRLQPAVNRQRDSPHAPQNDRQSGPEADERDTRDQAHQEYAQRHARHQRPVVARAAQQPLADNGANHDIRAHEHDHVKEQRGNSQQQSDNRNAGDDRGDGQSKGDQYTQSERCSIVFAGFHSVDREPRKQSIDHQAEQYERGSPDQPPDV